MIPCGSHLQFTHQQTYLGAEFTQDSKQKVNIAKRIGNALREFNKMRTFWNHSNIDVHTKLQSEIEACERVAVEQLRGRRSARGPRDDGGAGERRDPSSDAGRPCPSLQGTSRR